MEFTELGNGEVACKTGHNIYKLDIVNNTCTCEGFLFNGYKDPKKKWKCKHLKEYEKLKRD